MANMIPKNDVEGLLEIKQNEQSELVSSSKMPLATHESFTELEKDRIIQMAWEDRTPFEAIEFQFGLKEKQVIEFKRKHSLPSSFRLWRKPMTSRNTKHSFFRAKSVDRFKCSRRRISENKIAKRSVLLYSNSY